MNGCLKLKKTHVNYITEHYSRFFAKQHVEQKFAVVHKTETTPFCGKN